MQIDLTKLKKSPVPAALTDNVLAYYRGDGYRVYVKPVSLEVWKGDVRLRTRVGKKFGQGVTTAEVKAEVLDMLTTVPDYKRAQVEQPQEQPRPAAHRPPMRRPRARALAFG